MGILVSALPFVAIGLTAAQADYSEQYEKIAVAVSSVQTCEQLGYTVDREGLVAWTKQAQQSAMARGLSEAEARARLEQAVNAQHAADFERFADAKRMEHSEELVSRNNRLWRSRCSGLAEEPSSEAYFTKAGD
ncbi:hypothetical protein GRI42_05640 [Erythrobacter gaetbuli]|uniref:Uncharacterized protein n=1 Tax=Qipengyuania gaetbuli TaxID=266952 RepID=A0A844Y015_9SPHN|nr:hypothetical protein [Qipengyuania gaetbuli]MXO50787.1 hypothetical protein [Qipengyuania gaetbuli]